MRISVDGKGLCEPIDDTERRIRQTADYIDDAERLAGA